MNVYTIPFWLYEWKIWYLWKNNRSSLQRSIHETQPDQKACFVFCKKISCSKRGISNLYVSGVQKLKLLFTIVVVQNGNKKKFEKLIEWRKWSSYVLVWKNFSETKEFDFVEIYWLGKLCAKMLEKM